MGADGIDLDVEIVSHGDPDTLAALHSGGAQFGAMTLVPAVQAMARGEKLRVVSPFVRNFVGDNTAPQAKALKYAEIVLPTAQQK